MLFVYPTPQYPRKTIEYVFKSLYMLSTTFHIVALVVLIADFYTRLKDSMPGYFTSSTLHVSPSVAYVMKNCTYRGELRLGNVRGEVTADYSAVVIGLMNTAMYVQGLFVLQFLLVFTHIICTANYTTGNRHLRCFGVHVPFYHILVVFTYVYCIAIIVLTWVYDSNRKFYHDAVRYCAGELRRTDPDELFDIEYGDYSIFTTAVYWPFGAVCFALVVYMAAAVVLAVNSFDGAVILLSEADAPWEARGPACATKKALLRLHTAQRNAIIDDARGALREGERVRIVRSYQLMTEDDFNALVQAMRDQVARALKEKQFEKLRENFGDHESQIDDMGFLWRHHLPGARPDSAENGGAPEQFYDVDFGDYFTDNDYGHDEPVGHDFRFGDGSVGGDAPLVSPEELEYANDPLYPPADDEDDEGVGAGGGLAPPPYDEDDVDVDDDDDDDDGYWDYPAEADDDDDGVGEEDERGRRHHRRHRTHRRRRSSGNHRGYDDDDDGGGYDEPEPRSPAYGDYSPQEGDGRHSDEYGWGGGRDGERRERRRRGGGRQAEVEDDLVDADALSGGDEFF